MNFVELKKLLSTDVFSRADILNVAQKIDISFKNTQLRYLIGKLLKEKEILRVNHNQYTKNISEKNKAVYKNSYSNISKQIISFMKKKYPLVKYRLWELIWLNEFFNHQITENKIFFEIEKDSYNFIYYQIPEKWKKKILLAPTIKELYLYGKDKDIIIDKLSTESPKGNVKIYNLSLEKLIVDLFSNKILQSILSKGDYPLAISEMFRKYNINQTKMFRYARRKNKEQKLYSFLREKTNVKLFKDFIK